MSTILCDLKNLILLISLHFCLTTSVEQFDNNYRNSSDFVSASGRASPVHSDEYVGRQLRQCRDTRNLLSCIKYKATKIVWKFATNDFAFFPHEHGRELREDKRRIRFIQLDEPSDIAAFSNARSQQEGREDVNGDARPLRPSSTSSNDGNVEAVQKIITENRRITTREVAEDVDISIDDSELLGLIKFIKRAAEMFGQRHGFQFVLSSDSGLRITDTGLSEEGRGRHEKKKHKWLVILPLIILMKIAYLKMTVVGLLVGVLGLNAVIIGGVGWLIHYLKHKTLCKIHPKFVQHHLHTYDGDPTGE
ncbi:osiris 1 [Glossina fuscipes fuscipes]